MNKQPFDAHTVRTLDGFGGETTARPKCSKERREWAEHIGALVTLQLCSGNYQGAAEVVQGCRESDPDLLASASELSVQERYELHPSSVLSMRTANALESVGIRTMAALAERSTSDLLGLPNIGDKTVEEIHWAFHRLRITWHGRDKTTMRRYPPEQSE